LEYRPVMVRSQDAKPAEDRQLLHNWICSGIAFFT
jgi:hypothetical protein